MNSFLKVLGLILLAVVAVMYLPEIFALGVVLGLGVVALGAVGVSVLAALVLVVTVLAAVLAPVWVPVMLLVAFIMLIRRASRRTA